MGERLCAMREYDWVEVERTRAFITQLFCGPAPDRPAAIVHAAPSPAAPPPTPPPNGLNDFQRQAWNQVEGLRRRPLGGDDFVPAVGTGAGTCAMATAFGCEETEASGVCWVRPCIADPAQIDRLRPPQLTAGKLGRVLEQTRACAEILDERLPLRIMDFQSPFTTVEQMLGSERFFLMPYDEPRRLHALMDVVTDFAIAFFQAQIRAAGPAACPGIWPSFWFPPQAGIQMSDDNLVNVSPEVYDEFVVPYNNRIAAAFGGLFLHSCTLREASLPSLRKLKGLTGINCDVSTSVSTARLLDEFGERLVVAPHAYINTETNFADYTAFMDNVLSGWRPGRRLFIYPCTVMYIPATAREIRFDEAQARAALDRFPGWRRDHGRSTAGLATP
ncbi:MAG: methylcobalamin:coenzyme M methyltransferase [Lentisphaerae bacterium ADurb.BinA184]|nr:MAG: methylcobalamin:coenzyme M methyltransferase [Lentisphaerae bacterium ADurb.BinA184]